METERRSWLSLPVRPQWWKDRDADGAVLLLPYGLERLQAVHATARLKTGGRTASEKETEGRWLSQREWASMAAEAARVAPATAGPGELAVLELPRSAEPGVVSPTYVSIGEYVEWGCFDGGVRYHSPQYHRDTLPALAVPLMDTATELAAAFEWATRERAPSLIPSTPFPPVAGRLPDGWILDALRSRHPAGLPRASLLTLLESEERDLRELGLTLLGSRKPGHPSRRAR